MTTPNEHDDDDNQTTVPPRPAPTPTGPRSAPLDQPGSAPWPAKGVLWWAGLIAFAAIGKFSRFHEGGKLGESLSLFALLGSAISIAICFWWYDLSKRRSRRVQRSRIVGYILFGIGSSSPSTGFSIGPLLALSSKGLGYGETQTMAAGLVVLYLLLAACCLTGAYYLVFRPRREAT